MRLHGYWRSSSSWRVRIALHYKGVAFENAPVHLLQDGGAHHLSAYHTINPMEQVPALEVEPGTWLAQSIAILEYLEETIPDPPLLPGDPISRARARQLAEISNSGIQPLHNLTVLQTLRAHGVDEKAWCRQFISRGLAAIAEIAASHGGRFLVGDHPTFADVCLVPQLHAARRFELDLAPFPRLIAVEEACMQLPAFQAAHAHRQPDAPTTGGVP